MSIRIERSSNLSLASTPIIEDYEEKEASVTDYVKNLTTHPLDKTKRYLLSIFPILQWIYRYNLTWLVGDLIAGITISTVVVPQGMSYAKVASLPPEFGLYSSFVGVFIYCFFATSKDVSIGPVAVMSLMVAKVIENVDKSHPGQYSGPEIATCLALLCGTIALGLGILRLGFILEFIPVPAVSGFVTGSAFTIAAGQVPSLMGYASRLNTRDPSYLVVINTLKNLPYTKLDAAFGLVSLFCLYAIKWSCNYIPKRHPDKPKLGLFCFYLNALRNALVIVFSTLISWGVCKHYSSSNYPISIIKTVPSGFQHVGLYTPAPGVAAAVAPQLPVSIIVLLMEHIAISKSFGRINNYKISADQEIIAIGVTNLIGTFFSAYPATGSFSRSALKARCGVRTPLAGIFTGLVVILALYALTGAFYWISNAALSAMIIHAVADLMADYTQTFLFWRINPLEAVIFIMAVFVTVFTSVENGIYAAICCCAAVLLYRIAKPKGEFLGQVNLSIEGEDKYSKKVYVPLSHANVNPAIDVKPPPPGVLIFRPNESFTYPNASRQNDAIVEEVKRVTRPGHRQIYKTLGDRPWNDNGPRHLPPEDEIVDDRPILRALIFDFSCVASIDTTGIQSLVDTRATLNKYAGREVEYHFAAILSPWIRRGLLAVGFGSGKPSSTHRELAVVRLFNQDMRPIDSQTKENASSFTKEEERINEAELSKASDLEEGSYSIRQYRTAYAPIVSTSTPFFHVEIPDLS